MKKNLMSALVAAGCALAATAPAAAPAAAGVEVIQASEQVRNMRATIMLMGDMCSVLDSVENRATAEKAAPKAAEIGGVLRELMEESRRFGRPGPTEADALRYLLPQYLAQSMQLELKLAGLAPDYCGSDALRAALAGLAGIFLAP